MSVETTLVLVKPDAVERNLTSLILSMIESDELRIVGHKKLPRPNRSKVEEHYRKHRETDYFPWLSEQLIDHPIDVVAIRGENAIQRVRDIIGPTKPEDNPPYTIRGRFSEDRFDVSRKEERAVRNVIHASSCTEDANHEIWVWFNPAELID